MGFRNQGARTIITREQIFKVWDYFQIPLGISFIIWGLAILTRYYLIEVTQCFTIIVPQEYIGLLIILSGIWVSVMALMQVLKEEV